MAFPLVDSLRSSFYAKREDRTEAFVGVGNFQRLFSVTPYKERLPNALKNNFIFFAVHMLVQNPVALLLATLLSARRLKGAAIYRTLIFAPTTLSVVIIGFIWTLMLNPLWGIVNDALRWVGLGAYIHPWLGDPSTALLTVSLVSVWQFVGLPMILFLAALVSIPDELIDAALVDGASGWHAFWHIKFPLIIPTIGVVAILTFVGNFNAFDLIYTMQGELTPPQYGTDILGTFFYRTTFGTQSNILPDPAMGTTIATVMFLIILSGVVLYMFTFQRRQLDIF